MEASVCCAGVLLGGAGACIELAAAGVELKLLWVSGTSLAGGGALLNSRPYPPLEGSSSGGGGPAPPP